MLLKQNFVHLASREFAFVVISGVMASLCFLWVYEVYYNHTGDVLSFVKEYESFSNDSLSSELLRQPRVKWFIWATYPFYVMGGGTFLGASLIFVFFSVLSKWVFFQSFKNDFGLKSGVLFTVLFLIPSFSYWTFGFTKESFVVSLILLGFALLKTGGLIVKVAIVLLALLILQIKPYILIMLLLFYGVYSMIGGSKKIQILTSSIVLLMLCLIWYVFPKFSPIHIIETLNLNALASSTLEGGSNVDLNRWGNSFFLKGLSALFTVFFKPFAWESQGLVMLLQSIEKILIIILGLVFALRTKWRLSREVNVILLGWVFLLSLLLTMSSPNLGTISRYSVYYLPVLVYYLLANFNLPKIGFQSNRRSKAILQGEIHHPTPKKK